MSGKEFTQMQVHLNDQNRVNPGSKNKDSRLSDGSIAAKVISHPDEGDKEPIPMELQ